MQVKLADSLDPAADDPAAITAFLERTVLKMVEKARRLRASDRAPKLPLIRLRVRGDPDPDTGPDPDPGPRPVTHCRPCGDCRGALGLKVALFAPKMSKNRARPTLRTCLVR